MMQADIASVPELVTQAHVARKADRLPEPRLFLMGGGKPAQPSIVRQFCQRVVDAALDDEAHGRSDFALGFAAAVDAVARGTIDFRDDAVEVVLQALADVENVTNEHNRITDVMRLDGEL